MSANILLASLAFSKEESEYNFKILLDYLI